MQGPIQLLAVLLLATLTTSCATGGRVRFDDRGDLSQYHTWSWLPREGARVEASHGSAGVLDAKLTRLIEDRMLENGFRRVGGAPDFYLTYQLTVREHRVAVNEPSAIYELSSHHASPSYAIEKTQVAIHLYSDTRLGIAAVRAGGRTLWRATFSQNEQRIHASKPDDAVVRLLARLPQRDLASPPPNRQRRSAPDDEEVQILAAAAEP